MPVRQQKLPPLQSESPAQLVLHMLTPQTKAVLHGLQDAEPQPNAGSPTLGQALPHRWKVALQVKPQVVPSQVGVALGGVGQAEQEPPLEPQAAVLVPATHSEVVEQQPPLHFWVVLLQLVVQIFCVASHAWPTGQSVWLLQPQRPEMHFGPAGSPAQLLHGEPLPPQALSAVPPRQVPLLLAEQQPLVHAIVEPQLLMHEPLVHAEAPA
jgi:hypothetical protein